MRIMLEEDLARCQTLDEVREQARSTLEGLREDGFPIVYVAGPISADGEANIPRNIEALIAARGQLVRELGSSALSFTAPFIFTPEVYEKLGVFEMDRDEREAAMQKFWDELILAGVIDGIYFTPGWERSVGARRERETAEAAGVPTFDFIPETDQ